MTLVTFEQPPPKATIKNMPLESLLLSRDGEAISLLQSALEKLSIEVEVCCGVNSSQEILRTEKFDAVIVDCDDLAGGLRVLESLRKVAATEFRTFAIRRNHHHATTTQMGVNFVLQNQFLL